MIDRPESRPARVNAVERLSLAEKVDLIDHGLGALAKDLGMLRRRRSS